MGAPRRAARAAGPPTRDLFQEYARTKDSGVRERLVLAHTNLAHFLARRYAGRGEPLEDLIQAAHLGLLAAIERFDPERGTEFSTFATATIVGEIKRYFRDKTWAIHVPRRLRELNNALMRVVDDLGQRLERSPTIPEIAAAAGRPFEEVVEALEVGHAYSPVSLDAEVTEGAAAPLARADILGAEDPELERLESRHTVTQALESLPERLREVVRLRYYEELPQAQIAQRLGISQMHVSRLQREALRHLRRLIGSVEDEAPFARD